jgi:DNA repair ATPase RecN
MSKKITVGSQVKKQLEKIVKQLESSRDELRELKDTIEIYLEDKDEDISELKNVIDSLSKYV